jgi:hypothetical protein
MTGHGLPRAAGIHDLTVALCPVSGKNCLPVVIGTLGGRAVCLASRVPMTWGNSDQRSSYTDVAGGQGERASVALRAVQRHITNRYSRYTVGKGKRS